MAMPGILLRPPPPPYPSPSGHLASSSRTSHCAGGPASTSDPFLPTAPPPTDQPACRGATLPSLARISSQSYNPVLLVPILPADLCCFPGSARLFSSDDHGLRCDHLSQLFFSSSSLSNNDLQTPRLRNFNIPLLEVTREIGTGGLPKEILPLMYVIDRWFSEWLKFLPTYPASNATCDDEDRHDVSGQAGKCEGGKLGDVQWPNLARLQLRGDG